MAEYSQSDVNSMRQDAIRRVREMQRRSRGYINQGCPVPQEKPVSKEEKAAPCPPKASEQPKASPNAQANSQRQNFSGQGNFQNPFSMFMGNPQGMNRSARPQQKAPQKPCPDIPPKTPCEEKPCPEKKEPQKNKGPLSGILENFFPGMDLDNDKILVILLIILLSREGADIKLLLALGYLMI